MQKYVVLFSFLFLVSCASKPGDSPPVRRDDNPNSQQSGAGRTNQPAEMHLTDVYWKLVEIKGEPVNKMATVRQPFLYLDPENGHMRGYGGCNRFFGSYLRRENTLVFNKVASTRMACKGGMEVEERFFQVLRQAASYALEKDRLQLLDSKGRVVATLVR